MKRNVYVKAKKEEQFKAVLEDGNINAVILEPDFLSENRRSSLGSEFEPEEILKEAVSSELKVYFSLPYILRENYISKKIMDKLLALKENDRVSGVLIHNIDEVGLLKELGYEGEVLGGEFLYAYNSKSIEVLKTTLKNIRFISMPELTIDEMKKLQQSSGEKFIYKVYGRQILMITAQDIGGSSAEDHMRFKNDKNENFIACFDEDNGFSLIYNAAPTYMLDKLSEFPSADILVDLSTEDEHEAKRVLRELDIALKENGPKPVYDPAVHTRGHYYKDIF